MILLIVTVLIIGSLLIATEKYTNINKAAVAIFVGTLGWILYVCFGADFVMGQHAVDYAMFLGGAESSSADVKQFIAYNVFLKYVGKASEIVLFLLATMVIVEILQNNGCFDFISQLLRTRSSQRMLWTLSVVTFLISANLDNLTTTVMMLTIMHDVVIRQRQRVLLGCAIVISANCGGALTVIGDPSGIVLWNMGAVTASNFSASMALPCLIAWLVPIFWIGRQLPTRIETQWIVLPYRGDDTRLERMAARRDALRGHRRTMVHPHVPQHHEAQSVPRSTLRALRSVDSERDCEPQTDEHRRDDTTSCAARVAVRRDTDDALRARNNAHRRFRERDRCGCVHGAVS